MTARDLVDSIRRRKEQCWAAVDLFVANRDAHGCYDLLIELQALTRAELEVEKLL